jgi:hypothetical protein
VFDEIGEGSSSVSWTIRGTRTGGAEWELTRANLHTSPDDLAIASGVELLNVLSLIQRNPFERARFASVDMTASVADVVNEYRLARVLWCEAGVCRRATEIHAFPGQTLHLQAVLVPSDGSANETLDFEITIPRWVRRSGVIEVTGALEGEGPRICFPESECEGGGTIVDSFDRLLRVLRRQPANNVLTTAVRTGPSLRVRARHNEVLDRVVRGGAVICLSLGRGICGGFGEGFGRPN